MARSNWYGRNNKDFWRDSEKAISQPLTKHDRSSRLYRFLLICRSSRHVTDVSNVKMFLFSFYNTGNNSSRLMFLSFYGFQKVSQSLEGKRSPMDNSKTRGAANASSSSYTSNEFKFKMESYCEGSQNNLRPSLVYLLPTRFLSTGFDLESLQIKIFNGIKKNLFKKAPSRLVRRETFTIN